MKHVRLIVLGFVLLSVTWCGAAENPFNVDCFLGWGQGSYRPGAWTPLEIAISSQLEEPFEGQVVVSVAQDTTHRMEIRQPFVLTPGLPVNMPLVTKIAFGAEQLNLRLINAKGRTCYEQDIGLWDFSRQSMPLTPVKQEDLFIGVVGRSHQFGLLSLTKEVESITRGNRYNNTNHRGIGKVVVEAKLPRMVPWDWTGFTGLDLLVLYDPDWSRFRPEQIRGMTEWVMQGGRLAILLGGQGLPRNALIEALPMRMGALQETLVTPDWLRQWGLSESQETAAVAYPISGRQAGEDTLFATGHIGFGRVGVLGLDPHALGEHQRAHSTDFWMHLLDQMFQDTNNDSGSTEPRRIISRASLTAVVGHGVTRESRQLQRVRERQDQNRSNQDFYNYAPGMEEQSNGKILDYLYAIDEMRPLSIGWVVLLLVLLAILLGPVDYLVLKRLDKLPLTWVTSLGWIVLFTVGAYYGVQALRAGDMQLRTVSLIDAVQDQGSAWNTRICGLFAPKSDEYQLDQLAPNQWFSAVAASSGNWNSYQARSARRTLYCRQINGSNMPTAVPINIWTMQTLTSESRQDTVPIRAQVTVQDDLVTVTVTNQSAGAILNGMVVFGSGRGILVDHVAPGETRTFEGPSRPIRAWKQIATTITRKRGRSLDPADIFTLVGTKGRSQGIADYLRDGAAVVCVQFENEPTPFTVKNKGTCKYHHVQFARLVVFPQKRKSL
ncbi:MAG: hypothetical protein HQ515_06215 [Phycisphaeraceae bacterium]|nr:hypothetical protein [Phycisphaeraceae bacterium]